MGGVLNAGVGADKLSALARVYRVNLACGGHFPLTANGGDARSVAVLRHVNAIRTGFLYREGHIWGIDFIYVALAHFAHAEVDAAFRQAHLRYRAVQIHKGKVPCPACTSARESLSTQILSPTVMGRFLTALPQSPCPPGCIETDPSR